MMFLLLLLLLLLAHLQLVPCSWLPAPPRPGLDQRRLERCGVDPRWRFPSALPPLGPACNPIIESDGARFPPITASPSSLPVPAPKRHRHEQLYRIIGNAPEPLIPASPRAEAPQA